MTAPHPHMRPPVPQDPGSKEARAHIQFAHIKQIVERTNTDATAMLHMCAEIEARCTTVRETLK
jgi:hypothetical protein